MCDAAFLLSDGKMRGYCATMSFTVGAVTTAVAVESRVGMKIADMIGRSAKFQGRSRMTREAWNSMEASALIMKEQRLRASSQRRSSHGGNTS